MARYLITAPTVAAVSLLAAKRHLNVSHSEHDPLIKDKLQEVVGALDPAAGGYLGRALARQTWELRLSAFPRGTAIELPYPPLISIVSVKYDDANGNEQTWAPENYSAFGLNQHRVGGLRLNFGKSWPRARCDRESVRIQFTCGYAEAGDGDEEAAALPPRVRAWILLELGKLYANRESTAVISGGSLASLPDVDSMLTNFIVRGPFEDDN